MLLSVLRPLCIMDLFQQNGSMIHMIDDYSFYCKYCVVVSNVCFFLLTKQICELMFYSQMRLATLPLRQLYTRPGSGQASHNLLSYRGGWLHCLLRHFHKQPRCFCWIHHMSAVFGIFDLKDALKTFVDKEDVVAIIHTTWFGLIYQQRYIMLWRVQGHFGLCLLITPLGNRKWTVVW